jgi:predicted Zn-dependent protease
LRTGLSPRRRAPRRNPCPPTPSPTGPDSACSSSRSRFDEAGPWVARLRVLDPKETALAIAQAAGWLEVRRIAEARALLERLVRENPSLEAAWFYLGQAALGGGDRAAASLAFRRFLALAPSSPMAPSVRGILADLSPH